MTGLIWIVQLVHYPSFQYVGTDIFRAFQLHHVNSIDKIVIPVMVIELSTSFGLAWTDGFLSLNAMGFYIVILIWISTGILSVPAHTKLESSKDDKAIQKLIFTNWFRTVLWTLKSGLNLFLLNQLINADI